MGPVLRGTALVSAAWLTCAVALAGPTKPVGPAANPALALPGAIALPAGIKPAVPVEKTMLEKAELHQFDWRDWLEFKVDQN